MSLTKLIVFFLVATHLLATSLQQAAFAQSISDVPDGFPSLMEVVPSDNPSTFSVEASDDGTVQNIIFVYKYENDVNFRELLMQPNGTRNFFSTQLPDDYLQSGKLLYYYLATDDDGNISTEGFVFNPLERQITLPSPPQNVNAESDDFMPLADTHSESASKRKINVVYVVLGVLAAGALASLARDEGGVSSTDSDVSVPFTVTTPLP
ncbi:MAG: hypothetical protein AB8B97_20745 [Granulosicoccus sp.]